MLRLSTVLSGQAGMRPMGPGYCMDFFATNVFLRIHLVFSIVRLGTQLLAIALVRCCSRREEGFERRNPRPEGTYSSRSQKRRTPLADDPDYLINGLC